MTNREKYKKTFDSLVSSEYITLEVDEMKKEKILIRRLFLKRWMKRMIRSWTVR